MKKLLLITSLLIFSLFASPAVSAQGKSWKGTQCTGAAKTLSEDVATIQGITCVIMNGLSAVLTLFSFVGFLMFVYASFKLFISSGSPNDFETAKNTFTYAIAGFVLALSSFVIINVITYYTGINSFLSIKFLPNVVQDE